MDTMKHAFLQLSDSKLPESDVNPFLLIENLLRHLLWEVPKKSKMTIIIQRILQNKTKNYFHIKI